MTFTEMSTEKRMQNLARANTIRVGRAQIKRHLEAKHVHVTELLNEPPDVIHTMKIVNLLKASPSIGPVKAQRILRTVGISPNRTVLGLNRRQRAVLTGMLQEVGR